MARAALQIGVRDLAEMSGVSAMTITRFENGRSKGYPDTWERLGQALEVAGLEFIPEDAKGAGVRYQRPGDLTPAP
ncbi:hypothetical protein AXW83_14750 [Bosea sp. PAMC 26642]|nr:hypothetical protein AXW83_14750 [Bosea sp. PAMC 26642]